LFLIINPKNQMTQGGNMANIQPSVQDTFKHNRARKNVIVGGMVILISITILSCVSSFIIYREGFRDLPDPFDRIVALLAVIAVEGAFVYLVYGFTRAFSSASERLISVCGMTFLVTVMFINLVTHFMMVKGIPLGDFQHAWIQWGAVTVFIAVLLVVLLVTLADPVIRLVRLELRYLGKQQEKILEAKTEGLESERIRDAIAERAEIEAEQLARQIMGGGRPQLARHNLVGFHTQAQDDPKERRR
jgi:hypothetical protein